MYERIYLSAAVNLSVLEYQYIADNFSAFLALNVIVIFCIFNPEINRLNEAKIVF